MKELKPHNLSFYLAGRYSRRERYRVLAEDIEACSGWRSGARWLVDGPQDEALSDYEIAERDIDDIRRSDALIVVHSAHRRGGMWVEFGYALASPHIRTIFADFEGRGHEAPPVFAACADHIVTSLFHLVNALAEFEREQKTR